jgi:tRNA A37 N6-isopentenylltransferase MiaA
VNGDSDKSVAKTSTEIVAVSFGLVAVTVLALLLILVVQKARLAPRLDAMVRQQAREEAAKLVQNTYNCCAASETEIDKRRTVDYINKAMPCTDQHERDSKHVLTT